MSLFERLINFFSVVVPKSKKYQGLLFFGLILWVFPVQMRIVPALTYQWQGVTINLQLFSIPADLGILIMLLSLIKGEKLK